MRKGFSGVYIPPGRRLSPQNAIAGSTENETQNIDLLSCQPIRKRNSSTNTSALSDNNGQSSTKKRKVIREVVEAKIEIKSVYNVTSKGTGYHRKDFQKIEKISAKMKPVKNSVSIAPLKSATRDTSAASRMIMAALGISSTKSST
jgi:hypothetical protein